MNLNEQNTKTDCSNCSGELERYKIALDFLKFEATTLWQIFYSYFVVQAVFLGFISAMLNNEKKEINFLILLISSFVGLLITILWYGTFHSNSEWYNYRMKQQAKIAESKYLNCIDDKEWFLLNGKAEKFADKNNFIKNGTAGYLLIMLVGVVYFTLFLWSVFNLTKCIC